MARAKAATVALCCGLAAACNFWTPRETAEPHAAAPARKVKVDHPGLPLDRLTERELERFKQGDALFEATIRESDGLGPLYVRDACAACHAGDGRGPGLVMKVAPQNRDVTLAAQLLPFGSTERPYTTAGAKTPLLAPKHPQLKETPRLPPAVFGRGYLEAIADQDIERLATLAQQRTGSERGRINRLANGAIGRFGLKARLATLNAFAADALSGDMGVSSPTHPEEPPGPEGLRDDAKPGVDFSADQVSLLGEYVRALRIPERRPTARRGRELFTAARCGLAACRQTFTPIAAARLGRGIVRWFDRRGRRAARLPNRPAHRPALFALADARRARQDGARRDRGARRARLGGARQRGRVPRIARPRPK